jgi:hypothetical protein
LNLEEIGVRPVERSEERSYQGLMQAHHYLGALPKIRRNDLVRGYLPRSFGTAELLRRGLEM